MIDTLCFSSGGIQGLSFVGCLKYLQDHKYIDIYNINIFVGTSFGAIIAFLLSINYTIDELILITETYNFKSLESELDIDCIFNNFGINNGEKIIIFFNKLLEDKLNITDVTFDKLYEITKKKLIIVGTNFTNCCEKIFSYENTPDISVILALRISISIPLIFTPVLLNDNYYVDGALVNNFPLNLCNKKSTFGFKMIDSTFFKLEKIQDLIYGSLCILSDKIVVDDSDYDFIKINKHDNGIHLFSIDNIYIKKLLNNGKFFAKKYLKNIYKKKIKIFTTNIENNTRLIVQNIIDEIIEKIKV